MSDLTLYLGSRRSSSWSMRPWLALKHCDVPFREVVIPLYQPETKAAILEISPAGKVPILRHGDLTVWDSLAICEYLNDLFPEARLWPEHPRARAVARAVVAEMHSGFQTLRQHMPFAIAESRPGKGREPGVAEDLARIVAIWKDCRHRFGSGGPFLFGAFSVADCFYAPIASRFTTYEVELDAEARGYLESLWALPAMQEWREAAKSEAS
jgi:glutathione S-transferase